MLELEWLTSSRYFFGGTGTVDLVGGDIWFDS